MTNIDEQSVWDQPRISEIYLFTNRNTAFFDDAGEQIPELQRLISWEPLPSYERNKIEALIRKVIMDDPTIYLAKFMDWQVVIRRDELFSLLGYGPLYYEVKGKIEKEEREPN